MTLQDSGKRLSDTAEHFVLGRNIEKFDEWQLPQLPMSTWISGAAFSVIKRQL